MTERDRVRAMSLEEYAKHLNLTVPMAKCFREALHELEQDGRAYQDEDGSWHYIHTRH